MNIKRQRSSGNYGYQANGSQSAMGNTSISRYQNQGSNNLRRYGPSNIQLDNRLGTQKQSSQHSSQNFYNKYQDVHKKAHENARATGLVTTATQNKSGQNLTSNFNKKSVTHSTRSNGVHVNKASIISNNIKQASIGQSEFSRSQMNTLHYHKHSISSTIGVGA